MTTPHPLTLAEGAGIAGGNALAWMTSVDVGALTTTLSGLGLAAVAVWSRYQTVRIALEKRRNDAEIERETALVALRKESRETEMEGLRRDLTAANIKISKLEEDNRSLRHQVEDLIARFPLVTVTETAK